MSTLEDSILSPYTTNQDISSGFCVGSPESIEASLFRTDDVIVSDELGLSTGIPMNQPAIDVICGAPVNINNNKAPTPYHPHTMRLRGTHHITLQWSGCTMLPKFIDKQIQLTSKTYQRTEYVMFVDL